MEFNKILVPVSGTAADEGAIELACSLVNRKGKGTIFAVYVIPIDRSLPVDAEVESEIAHADTILSAIEKQVRRQGCDAKTDVLQAREVGPAIAEVARKHQVNLF